MKLKQNIQSAAALTVALLVIVAILTGYTDVLSQNRDFKYRTVKNEAYSYGERLDYDVKYGFIKAGTGYFQIYPMPYKIGERKCYDIRFQVQSLKSLEFLYRVRDTYRSILDAEGIFPWAFEQHIREGNYKRDMKAKFDHKNNTAYTYNNKNQVKQYPIPTYTHDIVSAFYYVRTMDLTKMKKGDRFELPNFVKDTTYTLGVQIHGREIVEVPAGKFKCRVIEPLVVEGGLFKSEGNILIYVTDDKYNIPIKVSTKILIGYVSAELTKFSGVKGPIPSQIKEK